MTTILRTLSHGNIETGFEGWHVDFVKFGNYFFTTRDFCKMLKLLAENPKTHSFKINGHPISELDAELIDDTKRAFAKFLKVDERALTTSKEIMVLSTKEPGKTTLRTVEAPSRFRDIEIEIETSQRNGKISIGEYALSASEFSVLAYSVAMGGFAGWQGKSPEFASEALKAIEYSESNLFRRIRADKRVKGKTR